MSKDHAFFLGCDASPTIAQALAYGCGLCIVYCDQETKRAQYKAWAGSFVHQRPPRHQDLDFLWFRKGITMTVVVDCLELTKQSVEFLRHVLFNGRCLGLRLVLMASSKQVSQCKGMKKWIRDYMVQVVEDGEDLLGSVRGGVPCPLPVDRTKLYSVLPLLLQFPSLCGHSARAKRRVE